MNSRSNIFIKNEIIILKEDHTSNFSTGKVCHIKGTRFKCETTFANFVSHGKNKGKQHGINNTGTITDLTDGKSYFVFGDWLNKLVSINEWRELQLDKILKNN